MGRRVLPLSKQRIGDLLRGLTCRRVATNRVSNVLTHATQLCAIHARTQTRRHRRVMIKVSRARHVSAPRLSLTVQRAARHQSRQPSVSAIRVHLLHKQTLHHASLSPLIHRAPIHGASLRGFRLSVRNLTLSRTHASLSVRHRALSVGQSRASRLHIGAAVNGGIVCGLRVIVVSLRVSEARSRIRSRQRRRASVTDSGVLAARANGTSVVAASLSGRPIVSALTATRSIVGVRARIACTRLGASRPCLGSMGA